MTEEILQARKAFNGWCQLPLSNRLAHLTRLRLAIVERLDEIARIIAEETGKPRVEALTADIIPVLDGIAYIEKVAPRTLRRRKQKTPLLLWGKGSWVEYMPYGVVLVISPWNYPFQLSLLPVLSALAVGNTVILKPSEDTPRVGELIAQLLQQAGFGPGVCQVIFGAGETGARLVAGQPDFIFFTGSATVGQKIQKKAAENLIPTILELGGKDPMIVLADANIERAVGGALWGGFTNAGQVCLSVERLYVHERIFPEFIDRLVRRANQLTDLGRITTRRQLTTIRSQVEDAIRLGAKLVTKPIDWPQAANDLRLPPIILTNLTSAMQVLQEETFGPVLPVIPFSTTEQAVALANDSPYGLGASVWSTNIPEAEKIAAQLVCGLVAINDVIVPVANHHLPFGGTKMSGLGRYHGEAGLLSFCRQKSVMIERRPRRQEVHWFPYAGKYRWFAELARGLFGQRKRWKTTARAYLALLNGSRPE